VKLAWRALVALGALLALVAITMDTTVQSGIGRVHNIGMQGQQLLMMILGCALFLAGIVLFAVHKSRQTKEEEQEEARGARERVQKAAAAITRWKAKSDARVGALEARRSSGAKGDSDRRPIQRLLAGVFAGVTCFLVALGATGSLELGGTLLVTAVVYSFWKGNARAVVRRLMLANIIVASLLYVYGLMASEMSMRTMVANPQFILATGLLYLLPLAISVFILLRPERPRSAASD
jgi:uncharacterized membrane protein